MTKNRVVELVDLGGFETLHQEQRIACEFILSLNLTREADRRYDFMWRYEKTDEINIYPSIQFLQVSFHLPPTEELDHDDLLESQLLVKLGEEERQVLEK